MGHVARMGDRIGTYRVLFGKPKSKRPLGKTRCRRGGIIKMYLQELGCEGMDRIEVAQDKNKCRARVNAVRNLRIP